MDRVGAPGKLKSQDSIFGLINLLFLASAEQHEPPKSWNALVTKRKIRHPEVLIHHKSLIAVLPRAKKVLRIPVSWSDMMQDG